MRQHIMLRSTFDRGASNSLHHQPTGQDGCVNKLITMCKNNAKNRTPVSAATTGVATLRQRAENPAPKNMRERQSKSRQASKRQRSAARVGKMRKEKNSICTTSQQTTAFGRASQLTDGRMLAFDTFSSPHNRQQTNNFQYQQ